MNLEFPSSPLPEKKAPFEDEQNIGNFLGVSDTASSTEVAEAWQKQARIQQDSSASDLMDAISTQLNIPTQRVEAYLKKHGVDPKSGGRLTHYPGRSVEYSSAPTGSEGVTDEERTVLREYLVSTGWIGTPLATDALLAQALRTVIGSSQKQDAGDPLDSMPGSVRNAAEKLLAKSEQHMAG